MSTLRKLSHQVIRVLSGGDKSRDSQLDVREVSLYVGQTIETLVKEDIISEIKKVNGRTTIDGLKIPSNYIARFKNLTVIEDADMKEYYTDIPSSYIALPNNKGIHQVSGMKNSKQPFIVSSNGSIGIYDGLPASFLEGRIECYAEGLRLYYNCDIRKRGIKKVLLKIVMGTPSDLTLDDPIPLSPSEEKEVVDTTALFFANRGVQDKINDNIDTNVREQ